MSSLPEGAILTSIDGRKCTAVPRNVSNTVDNGPFTPTNPPSPIPTDPEGRPSVSVTSIGGVLIEQPPLAPGSPGSLPSTSGAAAPTSRTPRIGPPDGEDPIATTGTGEAVIDDPEETGEPAADDETDEDLPVSASEGLINETSVSGEPAQPTPTEDGANISTGTPVSANPTSTSGADPEEAGGSDDTDSEDSPDDDSDSEGDDRAGDDDATAPTGTDDSAGAIITTTLDDGVVTTLPSDPSPSDDASDSSGESPSSDVAGSASQGDGGVSPRKAGVIAGSVVGAVAAVALIAFLIWFWRKRSQKHKYTIQTPVFEPPNSSRTEKTWEFDSGSVGPTPRSARIVEAVGYKFSAIGKMLKPGSSSGESPGVNMNRGNSQFMDSTPPARANEDAVVMDAGPDEMRAKDRLGDWWSRVREDASFNWRLRNDEVSEISHLAGEGAMARGAAGGMPPDRRASAGSAHSFSGALGLMLNDARARGNDPFSDANAVQQSQAARANPFDDSNQAFAPLPQTTYDPRTVQRPRGSTTGSVVRRHQSSTPLSRNHVRSDQFDLEIDPHPGTRVRTNSFTSRVSSLSDWSEPGPDVGPAALKWAEQRRPGGVGQAL